MHIYLLCIVINTCGDSIALKSSRLRREAESAPPDLVSKSNSDRETGPKCSTFYHTTSLPNYSMQEGLLPGHAYLRDAKGQPPHDL